MPRPRLAILLFAAVVVLAPSASLRAQTFHQRFWQDYHRNVCWPEPFRSADRQLAREPFAIMVDNGWRLENTLSDYFFNPETQQLTRAGELKARWISTQAPHPRRSLFVLRGVTPEITQARVASVQEFVSSLAIEGPPPTVLITDVVPLGGSGEYFDQVDRQFKASVPPPRLPAQSSGGSGSSGSN